MKYKVAINRWVRTLTKAGSSLNVTIPHDLLKQWEVEEGARMMVYEVNGVLLILPLERLRQIGEPEFLAPFKAAINQADLLAKCTG